MKVAPRQLSGFLANIPHHIRAVLLHGSDVGLISERGGAIAAQFSDDLDDVFSVTRLDGDTLSSDPAALGDAAAALSMTADCRLVLVRGRGTEMLESCKLALARDLTGAFIVVEAGDTTTRHAIVKLFESAENAAAIGCYPDEARDIAALLGDMLGADKITITDDARAVVIQRLGGNRAASRREIEKLALLAGPGGHLDLDDVAGALGDGAGLAISDIATAAADGSVARLEHTIEKAWEDKQPGVAVLRGCQFHFRQLLAAARAMQRGGSAQQAVKSLRPPVHFRQQDKLIAQLRHWNAATLADVLDRLQDAELTAKTGRINDQALCAQTLLGICLRARGARR